MDEKKQLILIVEDERDLAATLDYNFSREGYRTLIADSGTAALSLAAKEQPDLVLLDVMLPDLSGLEVCRRLRQSDRLKNLPIIMATARGEEIDRIVGFEVGADDYVVKPYSVREVLLRVQALLRRRAARIAPTEGDVIKFGPLQIDQGAHRVRVDGEEVTLTALEFRLLCTLVERRGRVQSRETLLSEVWGISAAVATRTIDTHVKRLREKLGAAGGYIETLRGVGYRFADKPEEAPSK